jgi:Zn-dependent peptidase ImmA (M78 family)
MARTEEIEELAELLCEEFSKEGCIDPLRIAAAYDITYNHGNYGDWFDGLLECRSRRFHIYINLDTNKSASSPRARFSFAHELGHFFIDWHRTALDRGIPAHGSVSDFQSSAVVEHEADLFAVNLLLPRDKVKRAASKIVDAKEIVRLAHLFGTSISATAIRCAKLSLSSLIVMRWSPGGRAWCWSSADFEQRTGNRAFRALERIPVDSLTRAMLDGRAGCPETKGSTLSTWFPSARWGAYDDDILIEECVSLGSHGVLTLLRPD